MAGVSRARHGGVGGRRRDRRAVGGRARAVVTTRRRVIAAIAALTATLLLLTVARANAHPLHTTLTDVAIASGNVRATVRLFADDLAAATKARSDAEITAYVT